MNIEEIARIGFYVEGAVNRSSDANSPALVPSWERLSDDQKAMVVRAAEFAIGNPGETHHAVYAEFSGTPEGSTVGSERTGFTGTGWTSVGAKAFTEVVRSLAANYTDAPATTQQNSQASEPASEPAPVA